MPTKTDSVVAAKEPRFHGRLTTLHRQGQCDHGEVLTATCDECQSVNEEQNLAVPSGQLSKDILAKITPRPWRRYSDKLRPQFSTRVHEIHDARGCTLVSWGGFDGVDFSYDEIASYIDLIVAAVNSYSPEREAAYQASQAEIEAFWTMLDRCWEIEPREYFETEAPKNGFEHATAMAVHYMWKRETKPSEAYQELVTAAREVMTWGVEHDDARLDYITVQVDRTAISNLQAAIDRLEGK